MVSQLFQHNGRHTEQCRQQHGCKQKKQGKGKINNSQNPGEQYKQHTAKLHNRAHHFPQDVKRVTKQPQKTVTGIQEDVFMHKQGLHESPLPAIALGFEGF